jgi:hypothetical protein
MSNDFNYITIVSGLPRSGTSLMMQMLHAGGLPLLTDDIRRPDEDNPRGYCELEEVKQIRNDHSWLDRAIGKAVKIIHLLLPELPDDREYRVIFLRRDLSEVIASQQVMLARQGRAGPQISPDQLRQQFELQVEKVVRWMAARPNLRFLEMSYEDLIRDPDPCISKIEMFLERELDRSAMRQAVDPRLYRNRAGSRDEPLQEP